jgi:hypothetical protein
LIVFFVVFLSIFGFAIVDVVVVELLGEGYVIGQLIATAQGSFDAAATGCGFLKAAQFVDKPLRSWVFGRNHRTG